ncbi:MAG: zinc-binding dehydrogenase [Erythrobacter sp.]
MQAWIFDPNTRSLTLRERAGSTPRPGAVIVRMEAAMVLGYMRDVLSGSRGYAMPDKPFVLGTNAVGTITAIGAGVYHLADGDSVSIHPHLAADERVKDPAQILIGLTAMGAQGARDSIDGLSAVGRLQEDWGDGVFSQEIEWPARLVTAIPGLADRPASQRIALAKFVVPYGGLLRGRLQPGETVVINGASGFYGSAASVLAAELGAGRIVLLGRNETALKSVADAAGPRARWVRLEADEDDTSRIVEAARGRADLVFDIVGGASSSASTSAALHSLRRGGRLVLMGSCAEPLSVTMGEMLGNNWEIMGNFMYPVDAPQQLASLAASGVIDLGLVKTRMFPFSELPAALEHASTMQGLDLTAIG